MKIRLMTLDDKEFVMDIDKHVDDEKYDRRVYSKSVVNKILRERWT